MLKPTDPTRERILVVGAFGAGKSNSWIRLAQWLQKTGSDAKVYVIFTDYSADRYLHGWDHSNIVYEEVGTYEELHEAGVKFKKLGRRNDWLVLDLANDVYELCKDKVAEIESGGKTMSEWALTATMRDMGGEYGSNWGKINGIYRSFFVKNVLAFPGHVFACAQGKEFMRDKNGQITGSVDSETRELFGRFNIKPEGKDLPRYFHSVLVLQQAKPGEWRINSIRERVAPGVPGRMMLKNVTITDFVLDYLIPVAGWEVEELFKKVMLGG